MWTLQRSGNVNFLFFRSLNVVHCSPMHLFVQCLFAFRTVCSSVFVLCSSNKAVQQTVVYLYFACTVLMSHDQSCNTPTCVGKPIFCLQARPPIFCLLLVTYSIGLLQYATGDRRDSMGCTLTDPSPQCSFTTWMFVQRLFSTSTVCLLFLFTCNSRTVFSW